MREVDFALLQMLLGLVGAESGVLLFSKFFPGSANIFTMLLAGIGIVVVIYMLCDWYWLKVRKIQRKRI